MAWHYQNFYFSEIGWIKCISPLPTSNRAIAPGQCVQTPPLWSWWARSPRSSLSWTPGSQHPVSHQEVHPGWSWPNHVNLWRSQTLSPTGYEMQLQWSHSTNNAEPAGGSGLYMQPRSLTSALWTPGWASRAVCWSFWRLWHSIKHHA